MKKPAPAIFIHGLLPIFSVILAAACVRFAPPALEDPAVVFDRIVFSSGLNQKADWAGPVGEKRRFEKGSDPNVYAFLSFGELRGAHTLSWKWYDPSRRLYRTTDLIDIGEAGKVFERYIAWDVIFVSDDKPNGLWTVAVFMDGRLIGSNDFEIK
jgi:hypothetical protein